MNNLGATTASRGLWNPDGISEPGMAAGATGFRPVGRHADGTPGGLFPADLVPLKTGCRDRDLGTSPVASAAPPCSRFRGAAGIRLDAPRRVGFAQDHITWTLVRHFAQLRGTAHDLRTASHCRGWSIPLQCRAGRGRWTATRPGTAGPRPLLGAAAMAAKARVTQCVHWWRSPRIRPSSTAPRRRLRPGRV